MIWNRRSIHPDEADLSALLDGELAPARRDEVAAHVDTCERCAGGLEQLSQVRELLRRTPEAAAHRSFTLNEAMAGRPREAISASRRKGWVFAPAAALTLLVALFAVDLSSSPSARDQSTAMGGARSAEEAADSSAGVGAGGGAVSPQQSFSATAQPGAGQALVPPVTAGATNDAALPSVATPAPQGTAVAPSAAQIPPDAEKAREDAAAASEAPVAAVDDGDEGTDWLLVAQIGVGILFVASLTYVFGPYLFRRRL